VNHNAFTLADGRDARLPVSIGSEILLSGESATADTRIHGHRGKVSESAGATSALRTDAPGGVDRASACDRHDRLTGISGREHG
jgi:hypothetical protein